MKKRLSLALFTSITTMAVAINTPSIAWAHPGHGETDSGLTHFLLEPIHAILISGVIVCGIAVGSFMLAMKRQLSQSE